MGRSQLVVPKEFFTEDLTVNGRHADALPWPVINAGPAQRVVAHSLQQLAVSGEAANGFREPREGRLGRSDRDLNSAIFGYDVGHALVVEHDYRHAVGHGFNDDTAARIAEA